MDHRTIVSFFTCQLVWVNRYNELMVEKAKNFIRHAQDEMFQSPRP